MTVADLVPVDSAALESLDSTERRELAVTGFLAGARDLLAQALAATNAPAAVARIKAELASVENATRQFNLSKEVRDDALEMVRRAEYALGKAIRAGQESGEVETPTEARVRATAVREVNQGRADQSSLDTLIKPRPTDFASHTELFKQDGGVMDLVDGVSEAEFDAAISDARADDNLSRANVVRKIRGVKNDGLTPAEKIRRIRQLAPTGMTSGQIGAEIGMGEESVRRRAKEIGVEITADKVLAGTHRVRVDSNHIVAHAVMTLEALVTGFDRINLADLDEAQTQNWTDSLTSSIAALNRLNKKIKETIQ